MLESVSKETQTRQGARWALSPSGSLLGLLLFTAGSTGIYLGLFVGF